MNVTGLNLGLKKTVYVPETRLIAENQKGK